MICFEKQLVCLYSLFPPASLVVNINVSSLSGVITSPGYPHYMQRANYEWTFRPTTPNTNVFVCFEDLDLRTYSKGYVLVGQL